MRYFLHTEKMFKYKDWQNDMTMAVIWEVALYNGKILCYNVIVTDERQIAKNSNYSIAMQGVFMDEINTEPHGFFEDLSKEKRKFLRKEFGKCVKIRYKIFFWSGIVLFLLSVASGIFSIYIMINMLFTGIVAYSFYICAATFTLGCIVSLFLTSRYHKRFHTWLKKNKNIDTKVITNKK